MPPTLVSWAVWGEADKAFPLPTSPRIPCFSETEIIESIGRVFFWYWSCVYYDVLFYRSVPLIKISIIFLPTMFGKNTHFSHPGAWLLVQIIVLNYKVHIHPFRVHGSNIWLDFQHLLLEESRSEPAADFQCIILAQRHYLLPPFWIINCFILLLRMFCCWFLLLNRCLLQLLFVNILVVDG